MNNFDCWYWFLIFGMLLGLILSWMLGRFFGNNEDESINLNRKIDSLNYSVKRILLDLHNIKEVLGIDNSCNYVNLDSRINGEVQDYTTEDFDSILGINKEIANILRVKNIETLFDLASATEESLIHIVKNAKLNVNEALVRSWPRQAQYLIENNWDAMEELRSELTKTKSDVNKSDKNN